MEIEIHEAHQGLCKSSNYHFCIEDNSLVHISKYAIKMEKTSFVATYILDLDMLKGKYIIDIFCSNAGLYSTINVFPAEDLAKDWSQRRTTKESLSYLNNFRLSYLSQQEQYFLNNDWANYYIPLIDEIKSLINKLSGKDLSNIKFPNLVSKQIKNELKFPVSYLIPYSEKARKRSLEGVTRALHQIWITLLLIDALSESAKMKEVQIGFWQSSFGSIASWYIKDTLYSLWYEFDMYPLSMCGGMLWDIWVRTKEFPSVVNMVQERAEEISKELRLKKLPLRPDIAILEGAEKCEDLIKGFKVVSLIECKNWEYNKWSKDIETQIIPYKRIFEPKTFILASMKKVPDSARMKLDKEGIIVIDEVYPNGKGEKEIVEKVIKGLT